MESYKSLLDRQFKMVPATCNVLLEVLLKHGKKKEALALFDPTLDNHTPPTFQAVNSETFNIMDNECFKPGKFEEVNSKAFQMDVAAGYNNIIAGFYENEMLIDTEMLFRELSSKSLSPDVTTRRTLIDTFLKVNRIDDALKVLNTVVDASLRVVARFGNRVFDELIKTVHPDFVQTPGPTQMGLQRHPGHHLDPLKCLDHITHHLEFWILSNVIAAAHTIWAFTLSLSPFLPQSVPQPLNFFRINW
nr:pentatricopeptide repeat-containing protein [Quercus suber]